MILTLLLIGVSSMVSLLFVFLPDGNTLPFGLDAVVVNAWGYFQGFLSIFPPMVIVVQAFAIYLGFRLAMMFIKLFLGSRTPDIK